MLAATIWGVVLLLLCVSYRACAALIENVLHVPAMSFSFISSPLLTLIHPPDPSQTLPPPGSLP